MRTARLAAAAALFAFAAHAKTVTITFDDLVFPAGLDYWNGSDLSGGFTTEDTFFSNDYNAAWAAWSGFSYSRVNDTNTAGFMNQFGVFSGSGVGGKGNYAIGWDDQWGVEADVIDLPTPCLVKGLYVNNTTYVALSMLLGDDYSKKFGGETGMDPDWLTLTIIGRDEDGNISGSKMISLADYRSPLPSEDGIVRDWTWVDLTILGDSVKQLCFMLASSDTGNFGINTPTYFAIDNLVFEAPDSQSETAQLDTAQPDLAVYTAEVKYARSRGAYAKITVGNAGAAACTCWVTVFVTTPCGKTIKQSVKVGTLEAGKKQTVKVPLLAVGQIPPRGTYTLRAVGISDQPANEIQLNNNEIIQHFKW